MSTLKQIDANRLNAQHSTGPRSAEGKAASSANSLKSGLYARTQVIAGEDPVELRALADQYFLRWQPATVEESFLVATLINAEWLLRRLSLAEAKVRDCEANDDRVRAHPNVICLIFVRCRPTFPILQRRTDSAQRTFHRALHHLERLQAKRRTATPQSTQKAAPEPPESQKPISPKSNRLNQKLGSFRQIALAPALAPGPPPGPAPVPKTAEPPAPEPLAGSRR